MSDKIYEAIMSEVKSGTFTADALALMNKALEGVKSLEADNARKDSAIRDLQHQIAQLKTQADAQTAKEPKLNAREEALSKRDAALGDAEKRVAVAEAREVVRKEVFDTIFKNVTVRRNVQNNVPVPGGNGNYMMSGSENAETTQE